ncbi:hypothetical protein [Nonomuraea typhae]|uniref:hypothetical protein n=1 Tax=Nonomuraea typhae TaxID=2603600 RepID=UPI0012F83761|nr:hypothetical protein [Nonomuraea typhae]
MDAVLVTEVVAALLAGAAGEAGKSAWASLTALAKRRFGGDEDAVAALESAEAADTQHVVTVLQQKAAEDAEFAGELSSWATQTRQTLHLTSTTNIIGGNATIHGNAIQAGHIGSITLN